jgi:hypothetical protein
MPKQKDLKRVIRARMQKTGESYTAARLHIVTKKEEKIDFAVLAGMAETAIRKGTGHDWSHWVEVLDAFGNADHAAMVRHINSFGLPSWWSQNVVVGYERIRGLRVRGQRRNGKWNMSKSRTFAIPVAGLYKAWSDARTRKKWLPAKVTIRTATPSKSIRLTLEDGLIVAVGFVDKGPKSAVAVQHDGLGSKADADRLKLFWTECLENLAALF